MDKILVAAVILFASLAWGNAWCLINWLTTGHYAYPF